MIIKNNNNQQHEEYHHPSLAGMEFDPEIGACSTSVSSSSNCSEGSSAATRLDEKIHQLEEVTNSNVRCSNRFYLHQGDGSSRYLRDLRSLALSRGGLVEEKFRRRLWMDLVGLMDLEEAKFLLMMIDTNVDALSDSIRKKEHDERSLMQRDAARCVIFRYNRFKKMPKKKNEESDNKENICPSQLSVSASKMMMEEEEKQRTWMIEEMLGSVLEASVSTPLTIRNGKPHYYQGLHDIAGVLLHSLSYDRIPTTGILRRICQSHLQDAVKKDFQSLLWMIDTIFLPLLGLVDQEVRDVLMESEISISSVVLPWLVTWMTHDVHDELVASRLVDAFLASHPIFPLYFSAALMIHPVLRCHIVGGEGGDLMGDDDPMMVLIAIQRLPSLMRPDFDFADAAKGGRRVFEHSRTPQVTVQDILEVATSIMERCPPSSLLKLVPVRNLRARRELYKRAQDLSVLNVPLVWDILGTTDYRCRLRMEQQAEEYSFSDGSTITTTMDSSFDSDDDFDAEDDDHNEGHRDRKQEIERLLNLMRMVKAKIINRFLNLVRMAMGKMINRLLNLVRMAVEKVINRLLNFVRRAVKKLVEQLLVEEDTEEHLGKDLPVDIAREILEYRHAVLQAIVFGCVVYGIMLSTPKIFFLLESIKDSSFD